MYPHASGTKHTDMRITYGTNIASLQAQRRLADASDERGRTLERLSSGLRINRASDDAAGLAIADSLLADGRVTRVAIRNINDGISALSIVTSTLSQQASLLGRLSELAEQAANGVYGGSQRSVLDKEYQQLLDEFDRLSATSVFNGLSLLGGQALQLQVGTDSSVNSQLRIEGMRSGGQWAFDLDRLGDLADWDNDMAVDNFDLFWVDDVSNAGVTEQELETLFQGQLVETSIIDDAGVARRLMVGVRGSVASGVEFYAFLDQGNGSFRITEEGFNFRYQDTYFTAGIGAAGPISINSSTGQFSVDSVTLADGLGGTFTFSLQNVRIQSGAEPLPEAVQLSGVESAGRARAALSAIQTARDQVNEKLGVIGGAESRLLSALALLEVTAENFKAAESRIRDADIASESAATVRTEILQQVASSVLAQANQAPQIALDLLAR